MTLPEINETVMVICSEVNYPFPAVWDGKGWVPRYVHLRVTGSDQGYIEKDYLDGNIVDWYKIQRA